MGIYPFIITMLFILGLFGNGLSIFSYMTVYFGYGEMFVDHLPNKFFSALIVQVLTMIGSPQFDKFYIEEDNFLTTVLWIWFLMAIVMTNIIFLNVLIAIISDTFDRVWEQRETYILD